MKEANQGNQDGFLLSEEQRMLLRMRDTLYEGSWADFKTDLRARAADRPHVFETIAPSPTLQATIDHHLRLIDDMTAWETSHGRPLSAGDEAPRD